MKFVLVGQSPSVMAAARVIGGKDPTAEMVLLSCDGNLPYDRFLLPELLAKRIKEKELFSEAEAFLQSYDITTVLDKEITRINFNRRRVFLSDKQSLDYDVLILADVPQVRLPPLKGIRRAGVFHLARLEPVKGLLRHLPFVETAVLELNSLRGIETALALRELGKEVVVVEQGGLLGGDLDESAARLLAVLLGKHGVRILFGNSLEDILGESEVKAVRLKSGKVLACEAVIFVDPLPDLRFLEDSGLAMGQRVPVTGSLSTNMANVYAVDVVCQMESPKFIGNYSVPTAEAERQGEVAALASFGQPITYDRTPVSGRELLERIFSAEQLAEAGQELERTSTHNDTSAAALAACAPVSDDGDG